MSSGTKSAHDSTPFPSFLALGTLLPLKSLDCCLSVPHTQYSARAKQRLSPDRCSVGHSASYAEVYGAGRQPSRPQSAGSRQVLL